MFDNCIFCKIAEGIIPSEKIYSNDNFFSVSDANPIVIGHSLVISKKHFKTMLDIPDSLGSELLDCIKKTVLKLKNKDNFEGFNILNNNFKVAGQLVPHFHMHILPRKNNDGFEPCA